MDAKGCPFDSDGDYVPDYKDMEPNSAEGAIVDTSGVTLTDEDFYNAYMAYMDTVGSFTNIVKTVYTSNEGGKSIVKTPRPQDKYYSVQIASSDDDLSIDQIGKILSIKNVEVLNEGDNTFYMVGEYKNVEDAVEQKILLEVDGINGEVVSMVNNKRGSVSDEVKDLEKQYRMDGGFDANNSLISKNVIYRVQIGAFKNPLSRNVFEGVKDLIVLRGEDGLTRYLSGSYSNIEQAASRKIDVLLDGFEGAFIVAYKNGKRISLEKAGIETEEVEAVPEDKLDKDLVRFKVQVGAYKEHVPAEVMDQFIEMGNVKTVRQEGVTKYLVGDFGSYDEAAAKMKELKDKGMDCFVVGSFNDAIISVEEANNILNQ